MKVPEFYLASTSPRRKELLESWGYVFGLVNPHVNELRLLNEEATIYVQRMASKKSELGRKMVLDQHRVILPVLGSDTIVCTKQNEILGKPKDQAEAEYFLSILSATTHWVYTAVSLTDLNGRAFCSLSATQVTFRRLTKDEIDQYIATGEPMDKAGAYGIQGKAKAFVEKVEGSLTGVIGLPKKETVQLLALSGISPH